MGLNVELVRLSVFNLSLSSELRAEFHALDLLSVFPWIGKKIFISDYCILKALNENLVTSEVVNYTTIKSMFFRNSGVSNCAGLLQVCC